MTKRLESCFSSESRLKRALTSKSLFRRSNQMNANVVFERHPDLYFGDGDVVLAAKQTSSPKSDEERMKYTVFRVHQFLLKHHSAIFANIFADANAAPREAYDGVPLAEMHGDKAEDLALLLSYLYNPASLVFKRNDPNTPLAIAGAVRLADKYLIEPLHRCLVQQVCQDWPVMLDDYDIKQGEVDCLRDVARGNLEFKYNAAAANGGRIADVIPEPAAAILFAQEFGCKQILPAAFYRLALIPVSSDWGSAAVHDPVARWSVLSKEDLLRCMHGSQALSQYRPSVLDFLSSRCEDMWLRDNEDTACYRFIHRLFEVVFDQAHLAYRPDPLRTLLKCLNWHRMPELSEENFPDVPCIDCVFGICEAVAKERREIWERLPKWFKLE